MESIELAHSLEMSGEELFGVLTHAVPGFVWLSDESGAIRHFSQSWSDFTGMSLEDSLGHRWLKAIHPEDVATLSEKWNEAKRDGLGGYEVNTRCRSTEGEYRWHKVLIRRSPRASGFWMGCAVDIDDLVSANAKDALQLRILEAVATGASLDTVLALLCEYGEYRLSGSRCSILLIDEKAGVFTGGIAPNLPPVFTEGVKGKAFGAGKGSCGAAAFERRDIIVTDIATHPYWSDLQDLVLPHGVRASWSRPILGADGRRLATFGFYYDEPRAPTAEEMSRIDGITHIATMSIERGTMMAALRESEEHYRHMVELNPQMPWTADRRGRILTVSTKWTAMTGLSADASLNKGWISALHPEDIDPTIARWAVSLESGKPVDLQYRIRLKDGQYRWMRTRASARLDEHGNIVRWYGTLEDIHEHRLAQDRLHRAAFEDELTKLNNRRRFEIELGDALKTAARRGGSVGLAVMDLDDFKLVNDRFGHAAGDAVLRLFAQHLRKQLRAGEFAARLGGDEFAVIFPEVADEEAVLDRASAICAGIDRHLRKSVKARNTSASAGCAISTPGDREEQLMRKADLALYQSKAGHRGKARLYTPAIRAEHERKTAEIELGREALQAGWIVPYYQPQVSLANGSTVGLEALIRIEHPQLGLLSPASFMAALDHPKLGGPLGGRMLSRVIADMVAWQAAGVEHGHVALNLSSEHLNDEAFPGHLLKCLRKAGLAPELMQLEITERVVLDDATETLACALGRLREAGIRTSLDDFGTGYASLTHLRRLPVDEIKIDRSFIHGLAIDSSNATIVKTMINLGRNLGMDVVAEGVETTTQALLLRSWGCTIAQGFLYARPMPAAAVTRYMAEREEDAAPTLPAASATG